MKKLILLFTAIVIFQLINNAQTITDIDGNVYHSITIGSQKWMVENLNVTRLNDSTIIPNVTDGKAWAALSTPGVCIYDNTANADTIKAYGRLYNWYTINTGKLCPVGWHVPTSVEFRILLNYLGGNFCSNQIKEAGFAHWQPNPYDSLASNSTGFTALPGGFRDDIEPYDVLHPGKFIGKGQSAWFLSSSVYDQQNALALGMTYLYNHIDVNYISKIDGVSIRCLNDNDTYIGVKITNEFKIFPNPAKNKITLEVYDNTAKQAILYNLNGQIVQNYYINQGINTIDISNLSKGIYIIQIPTQSGISIQKLVKE